MTNKKTGETFIRGTKDKAKGMKNRKLYSMNGHRFKVVKVMKAKVCVICSKNMKRKLLRSIAFQCQDCHVIVHKKCGAAMNRCHNAAY